MASVDSTALCVNITSKVRLQQLIKQQLHTVSDSPSVSLSTDMSFWQLSPTFGPCQETLTECCSKTCDTSAVMTVTSFSLARTGSNASF